MAQWLAPRTCSANRGVGSSNLTVRNDNPLGLSVVDALLTVTKIKQERTNQDRTKIGPFFDFLLHYSILLFEISNIASQLSCEAMTKISSKNIEKCRIKSMKGPFLVLS